MDSEKKEFGKWWLWVLGLLVVSGVVFGLLRAGGLIGGTILERKVFENSYQYQAGNDARIDVFEAQLEELDRQLANPELDETQRANLEAQAAGIRIQLNAARRAKK
jgi:hypothetical protein